MKKKNRKEKQPMKPVPPEGMLHTETGTGPYADQAKQGLPAIVR